MVKFTPLITIGITCFNAEDLIIKAVDHALEQDYPNYEIIIVDDGSSDNSVNLIKEHIDNKENIYLYEHDVNKGFPSALNTIIENSKGEFITFFDDDDTSRVDRLTKQYGRLSSFIEDKKTKLVMCYTDRDVKYADKDKDEIAYSFTAIGGEKGKEPHGEMVADYILWDSGRAGYQWGMFGSCTLMVHKDLFDAVGMFDAYFRRNTEWDMAIRCALNGGYFIAVNEPLVTQKKTPTLDKSGSKPLLFSLKLREKHKEYLEGRGVFLVSKIVATSRFHGGKARKIRAHAYMLMAMFLSPHKIGYEKVSKVFRQKIKAP
jgi:glycosyltransferase involved in cell wall biosynthesis